jgi:hypothetical protein
MSLRPIDLALGLSCGIPVAVAGWALFGWLSRRARAPYDAKDSH